MEIKSKIQPVPEALVSLVLDFQKKPKKSSTDTMSISVNEGFKQGERNNMIFRRACSYRARGLSYDESRSLILEIAINCTPPLAEAEAMKCLDSAWKYSKSAPFNDVGNVTRLKDLLGDKAKFVDGRWLVWNGRVWVEDKNFVTNVAKEVSGLLQIEIINKEGKIS